MLFTSTHLVVGALARNAEVGVIDVVWVSVVAVIAFVVRMKMPTLETSLEPWNTRTWNTLNSLSL